MDYYTTILVSPRILVHDETHVDLIGRRVLSMTADYGCPDHSTIRTDDEEELMIFVFPPVSASSSILGSLSSRASE